jgi:hypothetical protein
MNCFSEGRELTGLTASAVLEARTAITIAAIYSVLMAMVPFIGPSPRTNRHSQKWFPNAAADVFAHIEVADMEPGD